jgi:hypothetical protein
MNEGNESGMHAKMQSFGSQYSMVILGQRLRFLDSLTLPDSGSRHLPT